MLDRPAFDFGSGEDFLLTIVQELIFGTSPSALDEAPAGIGRRARPFGKFWSVAIHGDRSDVALCVRHQCRIPMAVPASLFAWTIARASTRLIRAALVPQQGPTRPGRTAT